MPAPILAKKQPTRVPRLRPILSPTYPIVPRSARGHGACRSVVIRTAEEAGTHGAKVVGGGQATLLGRIRHDVVMTDARHFDEARCAADGAINALVIACMPFVGLGLRVVGLRYLPSKMRAVAETKLTRMSSRLPETSPHAGVRFQSAAIPVTLADKIACNCNIRVCSQLEVWLSIWLLSVPPEV